MHRLLDHPEDPHTLSDLKSWISQYSIYGYDQIYLLDTNGVTLISVPVGFSSAPPVIEDDVPVVLKSGETIFKDFYRDDEDNKVHLAVLVPILDKESNNQPLGVIVLRIDPETYLYPKIQSWPTASRTAETLLLRREGNEIVFLNALRFSKNSALNLRRPLSEQTLPAARAAMGYEGIVQGIDYRGVKVISSVKKVPESPWFIVARIDEEEIFEPLKARLWITITAIILLLFAAGTATVFLYHHQSAVFYKEKYKAAEELSESASLLRLTFDEAPIGIVTVGMDKTFTSSNKAFRSFLNYSERELSGKTITDVTFPEDYAVGYEEMKAIALGKLSNASVQKRYVRSDGTIVWGEVDIGLIRDPQGSPKYFLAIIEDITERKLSEKLLLTRLNISTISPGKNLDELIQIALDAAEELTGSDIGFFHFVDDDQDALSLQTWSTNTLANMCKADAKGEHYPVSQAGIWVECLHKGEPVIHNDYPNYPDRKGLPEGHAPIIRELTVPIMRNEKVVAIIGVGNKPVEYTQDDVKTVQEIFYFTIEFIERKKAQEEILRLNAELEERVMKRTAQLDASNKELEAFAYSVSHDLRSPLRAIDGFSRIMLEEYEAKLDAEGVRLLNIVRANTQQMDKLVTDLLDLSRTSRTDMQINSVNMKALVEDVVKEFTSLDEGGNIEISVSDLPETYGDQTLLRQVWRNLIGNAVKYSRPKLTRIIEIGGYQENNENIYFIKDNGVGFDQKYVYKLFGVFQRLHTSAEFEGTGIGLAIVQRVILRHKGRVWAEGAVDNGAIFHFAIPLKWED